MFHYFRLLIALCMFAMFANSASAQMALLGGGGPTTTEVVLPDPLTPEAVRELVSHLSDTQVRNLLLERLDIVAQEEAAKGPEGSSLDFMASASTAFWESITIPVKRLPVLWSSQKESFSNFYNNFGWDGISILFGLLLLGLTVGFAAEKLVKWLTRSWFKSKLETDRADTLKSTLTFLFFRLLQEIIGLIVFFVVARNVASGFMPDELREFSQVIVLNMVVLPRIASTFLSFILAPNMPAHRLLFATDENAKFMLHHQIGVVLLMGFSTAIVTFNNMNGVEMGGPRLGFWLNALVHAYLIWIVWRMRAPISLMMRGSDPDVSQNEQKFANIFPYFIIAMVFLTWVLVTTIVGFNRLDLLVGQPHFTMMFVLAFAPAMDTTLRGLVRHMVPPMKGEGFIAARAYKATKHSYTRIGRVLVFGLVVVTVADIWGLSVTDTGVGAIVAGRIIEFLIILAIGYLLWELVSLWINSKLAAEQTALGNDGHEEEMGGGEGGGAGGSRLTTVLPLLLGISKGTIVTIFGLIALANIGVDITPLLAGAGILGLAIGFGAQRLVADIVSGIFFLIDDAFRTGEYLDIEGTLGSVEKISIRSMQLRHHKGAVHTIPYGEIPKITNYSRDWVIMKLRFTVPFDTDPNKIKKMFKKIGQDMIVMPEYAEDFIQPFKSQGVFDFDDVGMIIRGKFMTKPGKQFMIRKEIYNRVKAAFEAEGIEFARREVRVAIPGLEHPDKLTDEDKAIIAAAATQAVQEQVAEEPKVDKPGN